MSISKFYSGRSVFITGGSGFIGKQIIEKLLRSCSDIDRLYVLMRAKKGHSPQQRLDQLLSSAVFGRLAALKPQFKKHIVPVTGDVTDTHLGISDSDRQHLESNVSIVIHLAATLSFTEKLRDAVNINVLGVQRMLGICKTLPNLESLVHVSTGYSQVDKSDIDEVIYDAPLSPNDLVSMTQTLSDEKLAELTPELLRQHQRPNTYTLTKAVAEKLVDEQRGDIPCCVVRPTIVAASYQEPIPGWLDNYNAANGVVIGLGTGLVRAIITSKDHSTLDVIPVDLTANAVIAAGWHTAVKKGSQKQLPVYHLTNKGTDTAFGAATRASKYIIESPSSQLPVRRPLSRLGFCTTNEALYWYWTQVYVPLRCWLIDRVLTLTGRQPRLVELYGRTRLLLDVLRFFTTNSFNWSNNNTVRMFGEMNEHDRKEFAFDFPAIDLEKYYCNLWKGIKKYILKERETDVQELAEKDADAEIKSD